LYSRINNRLRWGCLKNYQVWNISSTKYRVAKTR
jgi:hypothetical protein